MCLNNNYDKDDAIHMVMFYKDLTVKVVDVRQILLCTICWSIVFQFCPWTSLTLVHDTQYSQSSIYLHV